MSALSILGTGATRVVGTALVAGLFVALGALGAQQAVAAGPTEAKGLDPVKARPGGTPGGFTVRLPDGRLLHFSFVPAPGSHRPPAGVPSSGPSSGSGAPSGSPSGTSSQPSGDPSADPSASGLPLPVVSSLFPSPQPSGSSGAHKPSARPGRGVTHCSASPARSASSDPPQNGADAVPPGAMPERPASTVPPPLGPQALLHPDGTTEQVASAHNPASGGLTHRGRLLGFGLALIGTGAALVGWRIRRL